MRCLLSFALIFVGCGVAPAPRENGVVFDHQRLAPLQSPCVFTAATGALVISLGAGEQGFLELRATDGALLANGDPCMSVGNVLPMAKSTSARSATIVGDNSGNEVFTLDFAVGMFLRGSASGPAISVDLGGNASDVLQVRLSSMPERVTGGVNGWDLSGDGVRDLVFTGVAALTVTLGGGNDVFTAGGGGVFGAPSPASLPLTVYGGSGDDLLVGGDGNDTLYGDTGNDTLNGGTSVTDADVYVGDLGTDVVTYAGRVGALVITVGAGANDGAATESDDLGADIETVIGGLGDDTFTGSAGSQTFYGGAGNDTFLMGLLAGDGAGGDTVYGEAGIDTVDYSARLEAITVTMDLNAANDGATGEADNVRSDIEALICPQAAVGCNVTGNALDNVITGGAGADTFAGGAGDDTFLVGSSSGVGKGADVISGGMGVDLVDFTAFGAALDVRMDDLPSVTQGKRIANDVENLMCPSNSTCAVVGNGGNNHLFGSSTTDTLSSMGGDDLVETNGGADDVDCGSGSDILIGTPGSSVGCEL
jgi:Ca2+-binding RTX toxin-like protein